MALSPERDRIEFLVREFVDSHMGNYTVYIYIIYRWLICLGYTYDVVIPTRSVVVKHIFRKSCLFRPSSSTAAKMMNQGAFKFLVPLGLRNLATSRLMRHVLRIKMGIRAGWEAFDGRYGPGCWDVRSSTPGKSGRYLSHF